MQNQTGGGAAGVRPGALCVLQKLYWIIILFAAASTFLRVSLLNTARFSGDA